VLSLRDIRRRIRSVQSTRQIARAMEMVSAARLKRAQARLLAARPYAEKLDAVVSKITLSDEVATHPFLVAREVTAAAVCVVASDRGLCGSFNWNVVSRAEEVAAELARRPGGPSVRFSPVGRKAANFYRRRGDDLLCHFPELGAFADTALTQQLSAQLMQYFLSGQTDEVWLVYTHFITSGSRRVVAERLLPLTRREGESAAGAYGYIFEPPAGRLLGELLPRYVEMKVYMAVAESCASEHSARMVAMSFATKNADDMAYELTLQRNRARQSAITREIADIVGTAEAVR
ncbi:MAG: ATP synthase F1 subunit gamma, partial [Candidatus Eisenbacteria bacterium]|nr:ATP synthase F1 subunit gamma [Candidatus Eisenbacteria bacterium]